MKNLKFLFLALMIPLFNTGYAQLPANSPAPEGKTAAQLLGSPGFKAICYGGYRGTTTDQQPTVAQLKEDMKLLSAMGITMVRTYKVYLEEASNLLKTIRELQQEDQNFEMYVMLGAWIDCKNAWTANPVHDQESPRNASEIDQAVALAQAYPDIVKIIAVGNEAMVKWATGYYVEPGIILKWVNHLQELKSSGVLPASLWITTSDNFASWGGGGSEYHVKTLNDLIGAVDYISMHTYPMHDTHYNPAFWGVRESEAGFPDQEKINTAMLRAKNYAVIQYESVVKYMKSLGVNKPVHIGETGWASVSTGFYGSKGSGACDEFKQAAYYHQMMDWSAENGVTLFFFEGFDEQWKDAANPNGSENHFGLINLRSQAKYALWDMVDKGVFDGLTRDGLPISKTYGGDFNALMRDVVVPPTEKEINAKNKP